MRTQFITLLAGWLLLAPSLAVAEDDPAALVGADLYGRFCAACHGTTGVGDGPVAKHMNTPPTDLTRLTARFGNPLDGHALAGAIDGRRSVRGHGPMTMPVWGTRLDDWVPEMPGSPAAKQTTIELIVLHLRTIQRTE